LPQEQHNILNINNEYSGWYDYGARFYDPVIARFHTIDLLATDYYFQSPYIYASENPIIYIDYFGTGPWDIVKGVGLIAGGVAQIAGGIALACVPSPGITQIGGGALITNGVMNIGWGGVTLLNNGKEDLPSGTLQATGRGVDEFRGDENHTFEKIGTTGDFVLGLPAGKVGSTTSTISKAANIINAASAVETIIEKSDLDNNSKPVQTENTETSNTQVSDNTKVKIDIKEVGLIPDTEIKKRNNE